MGVTFHPSLSWPRLQLALLDIHINHGTTKSRCCFCNPIFLLPYFNMESLNWIQHQRATRLSPYSDYVTAWSIVAVSFILLVYFYDFSRGRRLSTAPIVGASSIFEPLFVTKYRFSQSGWATVQQGYEKVCKITHCSSSQTNVLFDEETVQRLCVHYRTA